MCLGLAVFELTAFDYHHHGSLFPSCQHKQEHGLCIFTHCGRVITETHSGCCSLHAESCPFCIHLACTDKSKKWCELFKWENGKKRWEVCLFQSSVEEKLKNWLSNNKSSLPQNGITPYCVYEWEKAWLKVLKGYITKMRIFFYLRTHSSDVFKHMHTHT